MSALTTMFPALSAHLSDIESSMIEDAGTSIAQVVKKIHESRLDEQFGPHNWSCRYRQCGGSVICQLTVWVENGENTVAKSGNAYFPRGGPKEVNPIEDPFHVAFLRASQQLGCLRDFSFAVPKPEPAPNPRRSVVEEKWDKPLAGVTFTPWLIKYGQHFKVDVMKMVHKVAADNRLPQDLRTWSQEQVDRMYAYLANKAKSMAIYKNEFTH